MYIYIYIYIYTYSNYEGPCIQGLITVLRLCSGKALRWDVVFFFVLFRAFGVCRYGSGVPDLGLCFIAKAVGVLGGGD